VSVESLWSKVDLSVRESSTQENSDESERISFRSASNPWTKRKVVLLDAIGLLVWSYIVVKLFVFDVDNYLVARFTPSIAPLLGYRFLFVGGIAILLILFSKGRRRKYLYVGIFPLVVLFWKLPKWFYKAQNWVAVIAFLNLVATAIRHLKFNVVTRFFGILSLVFVATSHNFALLALSAVYLGVYFALLMVRTVWFSIKPSHFLKSQQALISKISNGTFITHMTTVGEELRDATLEKFSASQLNTFQTNLGMALLYNRAIYYWAYQLERYRTSAAALILSSVAYIGLYLQGILAFSAINWAILKIDPEAFSFSGPQTFLQVMYYSLFHGAGSSLTPISTAAVAVKIATNIVGPLFVTALIAQFLISRRQVEQETATQEAVSKIKAAGAELEANFRLEYEVSIEEAIVRLRDLGENFFVTAIMTISSKLPAGYDAE
jgi:hypothetical protein